MEITEWIKVAKMAAPLLATYLLIALPFLLIGDILKKKFAHVGSIIPLAVHLMALFLFVFGVVVSIYSLDKGYPLIDLILIPPVLAVCVYIPGFLIVIRYKERREKLFELFNEIMNRYITRR